MAYFKQSGTSSRRNDRLRNGDDVHLIRPTDQEERIANVMMQDKIETKDTPLGRLTQSYKTTVIYYHIKATGRNDFVTSTGNVGSVDVNKNSFQRIKDFIILCQDALNVTLEKDETKDSLMGTGSAKVLPKTIQPLVGDHFIMMTLNKKNLYRVTGVNKTSIETDSAYEFTYQLVEEETEEKLREIEYNVVEKYQFIYSHVGTSFRTLFREDEYVVLEHLSEMYEKMAELFNEFFYNEEKNTYILRYNSADIKDESGVSIQDSKIIAKPYVTLPSDSGLNTAPKLNNSDVWYGSLMYDRMLIEFITKTGLFTNIGGRIYRPAQLQKDLERWYSKTIWYALEHRSSSRFTFRYLLPSPVTRVNIASTLNLYGVVSLEPMNGFMASCLPLYHPKLIQYTFWEGCEERDIEDFNINTYTSMIDIICETIGLWINKKGSDKAITDRLMKIYTKLDEFADISARDQNQFYLFPMLSFVVRKMMDSLSDPNFILAVNNPQN